MRSYAGFFIGLFGVLHALLVLPAQASENTTLPSVVSLNLCTDTWVLQLAAPEQIVGLSPLARDASLSRLYVEAADFPVIQATVESILRYQPDTVLLGAYGHALLETQLQRFGVTVVRMPDITSLDAMQAWATRLGAVLGQPMHARAQVDRIALFMQQHPLPAADAHKTLRIWHAGGYIPLHAGVLGEILTRKGYAVDMTAAGQKMSIESALRYPVDVMLVPSGDSKTPALASELLHHPAWQAAEKAGIAPTWLTIPANQTICPEVGMLDVIQSIGSL